ncbi:unnamed protein product [Pelagomonas calceolata]|uniref:MYND-type domain-containing protein n=1 Tax=Pelagomonas calceolata TaxID=35677 RepID=A0A8J2SHS4_9STRA|nr:unnamed protein product [Pelagomonas calceolata]
MILTNCAACAAPLAHTAPRCVRCHTRYCNKTCQMDHWRRGHKQMCKKIHRGGNAEQYHADKKYKEAVAVAVEKCADDTKGQTCYICTQSLHWKTKEGLVRGCACRGTAGFAHVSCLAEQAKILVAEAEENNLGFKVLNERWARWSTCGLCEQRYHGVVSGALGWACWKTYVGRPETDEVLRMAMNLLGNGLYTAGHYEDALSVRAAQLSTYQRSGASAEDILAVQSNLANTYAALGRLEKALSMERDIYYGRLKLNGEEHRQTLVVALNYASSLVQLQHFEEAKSLMRKTTPVARRVLGAGHDHTLRMRTVYAVALSLDSGATLDDLREAATSLAETKRTAQRLLGGAHPIVVAIEQALGGARATLSARETPSSSPPSESV